MGRIRTPRERDPEQDADAPEGVPAAPRGLLALQGQAGNAAAVRLVRGAGVVQRSPDPPKSDGDDLRALGKVAKLGLELLLAEPLTTEEMYALLLVRRAQPLSIPASEVNRADARIAQIDADVAAIDKKLKQATGDLAALKQRRKGLRGSARDVAALQIEKLKAQVKDLGSRQKKLLADRVKFTRGRNLGTIGKGAPAGTGQITYAVVQVIDAQGRRIALEFAETSAKEHAEEQIVRRLRATLKADELDGATVIVMTDQKVCKKRCQAALVKFAKEFGVDLVESRYRVRARRGGKGGEASPRTTVRTATTPASADLPVTDKTEEIYRRPAPKTPPKPAAKATAATTGDAADPTVRTRPVTEPDATPARRTPPVDAPRVPLRTRMGRTALHVGGNVLADIVMDLILAKYQQWRNDKKLRERLDALQPLIAVKKGEALRVYISDPWGPGSAEGKFYNVYLRVTSKTTTAIGGGRAVVIPGSPRPELVKVDISDANLNKLISEEDAAKVPGLADGATGGIVEVTESQYVVYSEPVE